MAIADWADFFTACAGAAAALAGLVIVAISVNIDHILKYKHLPTRAAATVSALILILIVALVGLMPDVTTRLFGLIVIISSLVAGGFGLKTLMLMASSEYKRSLGEKMLQLIITQLGTIMFIVSGVLLALNRTSGFSWLAFGILVVFVSSVFNAWVLLVEILR